MKISVAVLGNKVEVEVADGASASEALATFERISNKVLGGMDVYKDGKKLEDLGNEVLQDGDEIVAVKSKHESAAKITVKVLGNEFSVECNDNENCSEAYFKF